MSISSYIIAGVLVSNPASLDVSLNDFVCLTEAIYHEARGEDKKGQTAVANVILNRVESPRFPDTICGVVRQNYQFSYRNGKGDEVLLDVNNKIEQKALAQTAQIAYDAVNGYIKDITDGADHYYAHNKVSPSWAKDQDGTEIGNHTFINLDS